MAHLLPIKKLPIILAKMFWLFKNYCVYTRTGVGVAVNVLPTHELPALC